MVIARFLYIIKIVGVQVYFNKAFSFLFLNNKIWRKNVWKILAENVNCVQYQYAKYDTVLFKLSFLLSAFCSYSVVSWTGIMYVFLKKIWIKVGMDTYSKESCKMYMFNRTISFKLCQSDFSLLSVIFLWATFEWQRYSSYVEDRDFSIYLL